MAKKEGPERVGNVLGGFLEKSGLKEPILRVGALEEWDEKVGEAIARVTRPKAIRGSTMIVEVRSSAWLMELNLMKSEILRRLNADREEGQIGDIVFVLSEQG